MKVHELNWRKWLKKKANRLWRWNWSKWNTCWRGYKWQKSRTWSSVSAFFEWWQTPIVQRLPKMRGFKRYFKLKKNYKPINLWVLDLDERIKDIVNKDILIWLWYIKKWDIVKVLWNWDLKKNITFEWIDKFSKTAIKKIEDANWKIVE